MSSDPPLKMAISREKALIFRITHIENVPWILDHGLHSRSSEVLDPDFREIGNPDLISRRAARPVPVAPGGTLADYVPFYFSPRTPMLYNICTGYHGMRRTPVSEIAILVSSVRILTDRGIPYVLTDRHAYLATAEYSNDLHGLDRIDWEILRNRDFKRSDEDPGKMERYQAEALVHRHLPLDALAGVACHGPRERDRLEAQLTARGLSLKLVARPGWYF
jgi:hypothetical protein